MENTMNSFRKSAFTVMAACATLGLAACNNAAEEPVDTETDMAADPMATDPMAADAMATPTDGMSGTAMDGAEMGTPSPTGTTGSTMGATPGAMPSPTGTATTGSTGGSTPTP